MERFIAPAPSSVYAYTGSTTIAGNWEIDLLASGGIAFITDDGALNGASTALSSTAFKTFSVVRSFGTYAHIVDGIDIASLRVKKTAYAAPAIKTVALGQDNNSSVTAGLSLNLPSLIANGDSYGVMVTNLMLPHEQTKRNRVYELSVVDSDILTGTGTTNIIAKLVAKINADTSVNCIVTAAATTAGTSDNAGIVFTAKTAGVNFSVKPLSGVLELATVAEYKNKNGVYTSAYTSPLVAYSDGEGTYAQMLETERKFYSHIGSAGQYYLGTPLAPIPSQLSSTATYVQYVLTWTPAITEGSLVKNNNLTSTLIIAVSAASGADATLRGILDAMLA